MADLVNSQTAVIRALEARLKALGGQTKKTSGNSSKPPSSDGLKKITKHSLRESSGKTSGGQVGHSGQTLRAVEKPDSIIVHSVSHCHHCQHDLTRMKASSVEKRQVFETPEIVLAVSKHQAEWKDCPQCGNRSRASFPVDVSHITQYGPRFRSIGLFSQRTVHSVGPHCGNGRRLISTSGFGSDNIGRSR